MSNPNYPAGTTDEQIDDLCGPDEWEINDTVINNAVEAATAACKVEYLDNVHEIIQLALMPMMEFAVRQRTDEYLETYKETGEFT
jgi:hypothetical protein